MSDGPHRSLNMRPHWKAAAQRAANPAHTPAEVCEAVEHALKKDILEAPIARVREIMNSDTLFADMRIEQLEALRTQHPGSAAVTALIESAIEAVLAGKLGDVGTEIAVKAALEDIARCAIRSIAEHYQRDAGPNASRTTRIRLENTFSTLDCGVVARELLAKANLPLRRSITLRRQTGIDEGPPL